MAFCNTLQEILKNCDNNVAGIDYIYLNNSPSLENITESAEGVITGATISTDSTQYVEYQVNPATSSLEETTQINLQNGTTVYTPTLTLRLAKRDATKRARLKLIADGQPKLSLIFRDGNEKYWLMEGVYLTEAVSNTEAERTGINGYTLTFSPGEGGGLNAPIQEIDATLVASLI